MKTIVVLTLSLLITSCSSYVKGVHKKIAKTEFSERQKAMAQQAALQPSRRGRGFNPNNPVTLSSPVSKPVTPRPYRRKRVKIDDLNDNGGDGSLWTDQNNESFLFFEANIKKPGDLVVVEVLEGLKETITSQLKRSAMQEAEEAGEDIEEEKAAEAKEEKTKDTEKEENKVADEKSPADKNKVYDKISTYVIDIVNGDYLLLRGRKEVYFKNKRRYFEFEALTPKDSVSKQNTVQSSRVLNPKVSVLRYRL